MVALYRGMPLLNSIEKLAFDESLEASGLD